MLLASIPFHARIIIQSIHAHSLHAVTIATAEATAHVDAGTSEVTMMSEAIYIFFSRRIFKITENKG